MADANDDGVVSYSEWLMTSMNKRKVLTEAKLQAAFQGLDVDRSNSVSFDEIKQFLFGSKQFSEDEYLRAVIEKYDTDQSGDMSFEQFRNLMFELLLNDKSGGG